ncbi:MAG: MBL fold metallo-hydrolase [Oscillospiraceae bacterium]|jgi:glyoxylase-like metal-dependent hydrolase (beta-lactamase superfamily II)|nr:MBL fold metallo-hydrolase [Oscillospiraceae bacterium]
MPQQITPHIAFLPSGSHPLSADVGIIRGEKRLYFYDVGANAESLAYIQAQKGEKAAVLSHFHQDHIGNIQSLPQLDVYLSAHTLKYVQHGTLVQNRMTIQDGIKLDILPFPSTHAKGSLIAVVNDTYAFLGDALYTAMKRGVPVYNVQLLREGIRLLENLPAEYLLVSHDTPFVHAKTEVLEKLKTYAAQAQPHEAYLQME